MELKSKFTIALPSDPRLPILAHDMASGRNKRITLGEAKNMVFGAVLRGDTVHAESKPDLLVATIIYIVDKDALAAARKDFEIVLQEKGLMPLDLEVD